MAKCMYCDKPAVHGNRCTEHHIKYCEQTVKDTIKKYNLCTKQDKLCVAVSGGKDSQLVLHLLHKFGYQVDALLINEGIDGYRNPTVTDMVEFCKKRNISIQQVSFAKEIGTTLDNVAQELNAPPCTACGSWRRQLLNKFAKDYDYVVTGHNLDDESQTYVMNMLQGRVHQSARVGIKTKGLGFIPRIKPLYFLSEKDIRLYTLIKGFTIREDDCPYAHQSFRFKVRDMLNDIEVKNPGTKMNIVERFVQFNNVPKEKSAISFMKPCKSCGQPSLDDTCTACKLKEQFVH